MYMLQFYSVSQEGEVHVILFSMCHMYCDTYSEHDLIKSVSSDLLHCTMHGLPAKASCAPCRFHFWKIIGMQIKQLIEVKLNNNLPVQPV